MEYFVEFTGIFYSKLSMSLFIPDEDFPRGIFVEKEFFLRSGVPKCILGWVSSPKRNIHIQIYKNIYIYLYPNIQKYMQYVQREIYPKGNISKGKYVQREIYEGVGVFPHTI